VRCAFCETEMVVRREHHPYKEAGLIGITLLDLEVGRCGRCGYYRLGIRNAEVLHRTIAEILIGKAAQLAGPEIRFLRRCLGLSETNLARRMGVTIETVSRWEHGSSGMRVSADRLLRVISAMELSIPPPPMDHLGTAPREEIAIHFFWKEEGWVIVDGAAPRGEPSKPGSS
jgi:putative zinc finger/helix-turn-helix YgiT family protein